MAFTVGVVAVQGGFLEHLNLLRAAGRQLGQELPPANPTASTGGGNASVPAVESAGATAGTTPPLPSQQQQDEIVCIEVRTKEELARCDALVIPGGESTTIALATARSGLLEPLRQFVKVDRKPTWGTCAGLILLAESANATMKGGQELIGGLDVRVHRNAFGRQTDSFVADLDLPFLSELDSSGTAAAPFSAVFIRAPIVETVLAHEGAGAGADGTAEDAATATVEVLARVARRRPKSAEDAAKGESDGDIIAVRQGNVFGTSFHPELTQDNRIHLWWLKQALAK